MTPAEALLVNRTVRVKDPGLLQFFLPGYTFREELSLFDREQHVIYRGKFRNDLVQYCGLNSARFVSTVGPFSIDFTTRPGLLAFVFQCHQKQPTKAALAMQDQLDEETFQAYVKLTYILGRWPLQTADDSDVTAFTLFLHTMSYNEFLGAYFDLRERLPAPVVEGSVLTFLLRCLNPKEQEVSAGYARVIDSVSSQLGPAIQPAVMALTRRDLPDDLRFVQFYQHLRFGPDGDSL